MHILKSITGDYIEYDQILLVLGSVLWKVQQLHVLSWGQILRRSIDRGLRWLVDRARRTGSGVATKITKLHHDRLLFVAVTEGNYIWKKTRAVISKNAITNAVISLPVTEILSVAGAIHPNILWRKNVEVFSALLYSLKIYFR